MVDPVTFCKVLSMLAIPIDLSRNEKIIPWRPVQTLCRSLDFVTGAGRSCFGVCTKVPGGAFRIQAELIIIFVKTLAMDSFTFFIFFISELLVWSVGSVADSDLRCLCNRGEREILQIGRKKEIFCILS